jgi:hypothetical protein
METAQVRPETGPAPRENPFSTRFTRPGVIPFVFSSGVTVEGLVDQLAVRSWQGQIIGPHGSGKTSLLHAIVPEIERRGRRITWITLRDGQRSLPAGSIPSSSDPPLLLIVDGYEQLSWWSRWLLQWRCQRRGCGLLITSHADVGLPTLCKLEPELQILQFLAAQLAVEFEWAMAEQDLRDLFEHNRQNIRDSLFELYDRYEHENPARF